MISRAWFRWGWLLGVAAVYVCPAMAQQSAYPAGGYNQPASSGYTQQGGPGGPLQLAERSTPLPNPARISLERRPGEHPLMPALRWAEQGLRQMDATVQDYSCIVVKRERQADGKPGEEEWIFCKIRHKPFSVYMRFLRPKGLEGQEVIYVDGANDGNLVAHGVGIKAVWGTVPLKPTNIIAMKGQHYPITEMGVRNLIQRLLEVGSQDSRYGECEVKFREGATINKRLCTCIEVLHPVPRRNFRFHLAKIYVDNELNFPIRYEAHDWPKQAGGSPELIEEYTYLDIRLNPGFTDADFDVRNPNYGFREGH